MKHSGFRRDVKRHVLTFSISVQCQVTTKERNVTFPVAVVRQATLDSSSGIRHQISVECEGHAESRTGTSSAYFLFKLVVVGVSVLYP